MKKETKLNKFIELLRNIEEHDFLDYYDFLKMPHVRDSYEEYEYFAMNSNCKLLPSKGFRFVCVNGPMGDKGIHDSSGRTDLSKVELETHVEAQGFFVLCDDYYTYVGRREETFKKDYESRTQSVYEDH